jgi:hypothetical protein
MCQLYAWHINGITKLIAYARHICQAYARYMPDIYMAYNICKAYARHMPDVAAPAAQPQI